MIAKFPADAVFLRDKVPVTAATVRNTIQWSHSTMPFITEIYPRNLGTTYETIKHSLHHLPLKWLLQGQK
jgi:hypothetical protein